MCRSSEKNAGRNVVKEFSRAYLYLAVPQTNSLRKIERTHFANFKTQLIRVLNRLSWRVRNRLIGQYYHYIDYSDSNRGDIAVDLAIRQQLAHFNGIAIREIVEVGWNDLNEARIQEIDPVRDIFIVAGSGFLHCKSSTQLNEKTIAAIRLIQQIPCKVICYGIGANMATTDSEQTVEYLAPESNEAVTQFAMKVVAGTVRGSVAYRLLFPHNKKIFTTLDPAFLLEPNDFDAAVPDKRGQAPRVGINFAVHGPRTFNLLKRNLTKIVPALKSIQKRYACKYCYFVHSDGENEVVRLLRMSGLDLEVVDCDPREMLKSYHALDVHISQMMHSAILSTSRGTPTINLGYDMKNFKFFDFLGFPELCLPAAELTTHGLVESFENLWRRRHDVRQSLIIRKELAIVQLREAINAIASELKDEGQ